MGRGKRRLSPAGSTHYKTGFMSRPAPVPHFFCWCKPCPRDSQRLRHHPGKSTSHELEAARKGCPNPRSVSWREGSCLRSASSRLSSLVCLTCVKPAPRAAVEQMQTSDAAVLSPVTAKQSPSTHFSWNILFKVHTRGDEGVDGQLPLNEQKIARPPPFG